MEERRLKRDSISFSSSSALFCKKDRTDAVTAAAGRRPAAVYFVSIYLLRRGVWSVGCVTNKQEATRMNGEGSFVFPCNQNRTKEGEGLAIVHEQSPDGQIFTRER